MERFWWAPGAQMEATHHNLLPVMVGSGKRDCASCKILGGKEALSICRAMGVQRGRRCSPVQQAGDGQQEAGLGQGLSHGLGDGGQPETVGSQKNQKTISHPKM